MAKKNCILGNKCPNKAARKSILYKIGDGNHTSLKENCVFCGTTTRSRSSDSSKSGGSTRGKRGPSKIIDVEMFNPWKFNDKKEDINEKLQYLKSQLPIYKKEPTDDIGKIELISLRRGSSDTEPTSSPLLFNRSCPSSVNSNCSSSPLQSSSSSLVSVPDIKMSESDEVLFKFATETLENSSNGAQVKTETEVKTEVHPSTSKNYFNDGYDFEGVKYIPPKIVKVTNTASSQDNLSEIDFGDSNFSSSNMVANDTESNVSTDFEKKLEVSKESVSCMSGNKVYYSDSVDSSPYVQSDSDSKEDVVSKSLTTKTSKSGFQAKQDITNEDFDFGSVNFSSDFSSNEKDSEFCHSSPMELEAVPSTSKNVKVFHNFANIEKEAVPSTSKSGNDSGDSMLWEDIPFPEVIEISTDSKSKMTNQRKTRYPDLSRVPMYKIQRLLYKSLKLQLTEQYSSDSSDGEMEDNELKVRKELKQRYQKKSTSVRDAKFTSSEQVGSGFFRWRKRGRQYQDFSDSSDADYSRVTDHDYTATPFRRDVENDAERLAFETENLQWSDTIDLDDEPMEVPVERKEPIVLGSPIVLTDSSEDSYKPTTHLDHSYGKNHDSEETVDYNVEETPPAPPPPSTRKGDKPPWECPICLEGSTGQEVATTLCGHVFCKECIESYISSTPKCPTCRTNLKDKPLITLYNFV